MKLTDLKPRAIKTETENILNSLIEFLKVDFPEPEDVHPDLLAGLMSVMDDLDSDDYFGSEGWRHLFGSNLPRND